MVSLRGQGFVTVLLGLGFACCKHANPNHAKPTPQDHSHEPLTVLTERQRDRETEKQRNTYHSTKSVVEGFGFVSSCTLVHVALNPNP